MQFCTKCKAFCNIDYGKKQAVCSKCGHIIEIEGPKKLLNLKERKENIMVVDKKTRQLNHLPRGKRKCSKCGNTDVYIRLLGARSEEDYEEECYTCTECGHSWRQSN